jgi:pimeloyl-ACP methyl ester carboxylesterase
MVSLAGLVAGACSGGISVTQGESRPIGETNGTQVDAGQDPGSPSTAPRPDAPPVVTAPDGGFVPEPLQWDGFAGDTEVALLDVPVDYSDLSRGTIELFIARHPATDPSQRIGSLLVNPGGPGFGGSDYALFATQLYDQELLRRFDIIGWDPRGTGESYPPIDCVDDYDLYFGSADSAQDPEAVTEELAREFAAECERRNRAILSHVGTNNSARDMDSIRRALGEDTISYLGFSYGSELGAVWATLFPDTVRAAVLDSAADPTADSLEGSLQQMAGFEASLARFLAGCSAEVSCRFHNDGDAEGAFDQLMEELERQTVPSDPGRPPVGRSIATTAAIVSMYNEAFWPQLARALDNAQSGDGSGLLALHDTYYQRQPDGTWGNELEAFQVISCADTPDRPTEAEVLADLPRFREVAPRLVPESAWPSYFCSFFPPPVDPRVDVSGAGAGPILVLGTTGDPTTPLESTRTMARTLEDGRLIVVESNNHGAYFTSACARTIVARYLVDLDSPADGTECS